MGTEIALPVERDIPQQGTRRKKQARISINGTIIYTVASLLFVIMISGTPKAIANAVYGVFGIYIFSLLVLVLAAGLGIKFKRKFRMKPRYIFCSILMLFALFTSVHIAFTHEQLKADAGFMKYLGSMFDSQTPGGVLFAVPSYILYTLCQLEGSFIVLGVLFIIAAAFVTTDIVTSVGEKAVIQKVEGKVDARQEKVVETGLNEFSKKSKDLEAQVEAKYQEILLRHGKTKLNNGKSELGITLPPATDINRAIYDNPIPLNQLQPENTLSAPEEITRWSTDAAYKFNEGLNGGAGGIGLPDFLPSKQIQGQAVNYPSFNQQNYSQMPYQMPSQQPMQNTLQPYNAFSQPAFQQPSVFPQQPVCQPTTNYQQTVHEPQPEADVNNLRINRRLDAARARMGRGGSLDDRINARGSADARGEQMKMEVEQEKPKKVYKPKRYMRPPIEIIRTESSNLSDFHLEALEKQKLLDEKLKEFGVNAKVTSFTVAPAVTRFEIQLASGVRVAQVEQLSKDISYVLGSTQVRLELIEGKNAIGVEVPNKRVGVVSIKDLLVSREFMQHKSPLAVAIGKNINDEVVIGDISSMPHLLIAGSTGSGKSVCLNTILTSLLFRAHPDEVKLLLVDMKRVELNIYNEIPHMLVPRAICEVQQTINAFKWMQTEMKRRYDILGKSGVNNIGLYHSLPAYQSGTLERMPYIVMVIDEAADLIAHGKKEVEDCIKSLSSLARASGIHIILATQRPSVDVITSVIKTNFPMRIAFRVSSRGDSTTIINTSGAEKLVGRGDMLLWKESFTSRVQGAYIEMDETRKVMNYIRENNEAEFDLELEDIILNGPPAESAASGFGDADGVRGAGGRTGQDPMFVQVLKWLVRDDNVQRIASISGFQRQFGIGFARAGKIIDQLADAGYVSQGAGTKARQVLVTREDVERMYGE